MSFVVPPGVKFSQFVAGGLLQPGDQVVGLRAGNNTIFTPTAPLSITVPGNNRLFNGDMQAWQRGNPANIAASTTQYTADRWQLATGVNQACTASQVTANGRKYAHIQRNAGQTGITTIFFAQTLLIDMSYGVAGTPLAISFNAFSGPNFSSNNGALGVRVYTGTGAANVSGIAGTFVGNIQLYNQANAVTLTANPQSFSIVTNAAANNVTQVCLLFYWTPTGTAGVDDGFYISEIQLETSTVSSPFQQLSFTQQIQLCSFLYQKSFANAPINGAGIGTGEFIFPATVAGAQENISSTVQFIPKIGFGPALPATLTLYNPSGVGVHGQVRDETAGVDCTLSTVVNINSSGFFITCTGNGATATGNVLGVHWTMDADVI